MFVFKISRCTMCTARQPKIRRINHIRKPFLPNFEEMRVQLAQRYFDPNNKIQLPKNKNVLRVNPDHLTNIKSLLTKYNICFTTDEFNDVKYIFSESEWAIEKKILLLQEIGVPNINLDHIINFYQGMCLPVILFKANCLIDSEVNLAKNMLSYANNSNLNYKDITDLNEDMSMREYFTTCLAYYLKIELNLTDDESKHTSNKKHALVLFNSFSLVHKMLKLLKEDLQFSNTLIIKNRWLIGHHPSHAQGVLDTIKNDLQGVSTKFVSKIPKILRYDITDLQIILTHFKECNMTTDTVQKTYQIFNLSSSEFKRRVENLLKNPFTLVFKKHPRFILLVRDYQTILARVRYLEEKNLKFATIYTLTTFHNYLERLITPKRISKLNLKSFLEMEFENEASLLLERLIKHPCYMCVPLVQMHECLQYLKEHFHKKIIQRHIYAMLYNKNDVKSAYEAILESSEKSSYSATELLALCIYKIEVKSYFTGEGVLAGYKANENSIEM